MTQEEIIRELRELRVEEFDNPPNGIGHLYRLTAAIKELPSPDCLVPELFIAMERLEGCDLGVRGPLVHVLESLNYADELEASIRRRPNFYSVGMLNSILNCSLPPTSRLRWLGLLALAAEHPAARESTRDRARACLERHQER